MEEKISIIVPVYNAQEYLDKCVSSILNQDYTNIELILVDDGSKDESPKMCDAFAQKDNRVRVIHQSNGGVSSARNAGLKVITGDWFMFVDSDDYIENSFSSLVSDVDMSHADIAIFPIDKDCEMSGEYKTSDVFCSIIKNRSISISSSCSKLYKTSVFCDVTFTEGVTVGEDKEFVIKCLLRSSNILVCNKYFYAYRDNPESCMNNNGFSLINKMFSSTQKIMSDVDSLDCTDEQKMAIKEEFSSALYVVFRFYANCSKDEKKQTIRLVKDNFNLFRLTRNKSKRLMLSVMRAFGIRFGIGLFSFLRKIKVVK